MKGEGKEPRWEHFEVSELEVRGEASPKPYLEFLRRESMSSGLYHLPVGGTDLQQPHAEDELYYIVKGKARFEVEGEDRPVAAGSLIFVEAQAKHHFHSISEDLTVLVVFAPAET